MLFPDILKDKIARRQVVAVVGAGFSMPCGMPGWPKLMQNLLEKGRSCQTNADQETILDACQSAINDGQYLAATNGLQEVMSKADLEEGVRESFSMDVYRRCGQSDHLQMQERIQNLVTTPWAGIITTNYDELIEFGIGRFSTREVIQAGGKVASLGTILSAGFAMTPFFVKLHGSVQGGDYVLSTEEYDNAYVNTPQTSTFLVSLMMRYNLVYIGCSLEDEMMRIRRKLCFDFHGRIPTAYAIMSDERKHTSRRAWLRSQAQIEFLTYASNAGEDHSEVDEFLRQAAGLADSAADDRTGSGLAEDLAQLDIVKRLENIGEINRRLLKLLANAPERSMSHLQIMELAQASNGSHLQTASELSPDVRIYRILFLGSIGLLSTGVDSEGTRRYEVSEEVADLLASS